MDVSIEALIISLSNLHFLIALRKSDAREYSSVLWKFHKFFVRSNHK